MSTAQAVPSAPPEEPEDELAERPALDAQPRASRSGGLVARGVDQPRHRTRQLQSSVRTVLDTHASTHAPTRSPVSGPACQGLVAWADKTGLAPEQT